MRANPPLRSSSATCFAWLSVPSPARPVAPTMCPRASPGTASSGLSRRSIFESPRSSLLQRLRLLSSGCPRNSAPPKPPLMPPRASPGTAPSDSADGECPGRPAPSCPSAMPIGGSPGSPGFHAFRPFRIRFLGSPRLCGYGWVNDVSPHLLELCILVYPAFDSPGVPASCARWLCRG